MKIFNRNRYLPFIVTAFLLLSIIANAQSLSYLPAGSLQMYGGNTAPTGWLLCDGSAVSRTTYARLFAAIGTKYGIGNGTTTFNLPDLRGVFPKGMGQNGTLGANYANASGTPQADKMQGHVHRTDYANGAMAGSAANTVSSTGDSVQNNTGVPIADGTNGTPRTGPITEPANVGVNFIIKL
jgi:microcystin-dependent protein